MPDAFQDLDLAYDSLDVSLVCYSILLQYLDRDKLPALNVFSEFYISECSFSEVLQQHVVLAYHLGTLKTLAGSRGAGAILLGRVWTPLALSLL